MSLALTRRMVAAALAGELDQAETVTEGFFGLQIPEHIEGVPDEVLQPRRTWADAEAYDQQAQQLVQMFAENFQQFEGEVDPDIQAAGPS